MTTCRDIVTIALRKPGVVAAGRAPDANDAATAMDALQGLYEGWVANGKFGRLTDVLVSADYTAHENERVVVNTIDAITISIPDTFTPPATDDPWCSSTTRAPLDLAAIMVVDPWGASGGTWVYDGFIATWTAINSLTLSDLAPFAIRGRDGLASCLAKRIAEEYGTTVGPQTERAAAMFESALSGRPTRATSEPAYY